MPQERTARVIDWLADRLLWLGDEAQELVWEVVDWVRDLGVYAYALGAAVVLLWILFALWCSSRR